MTRGKRSDAELVAAIVDELGKGGAFHDPRHCENRADALAVHVSATVQRSLELARFKWDEFKWPGPVPPRLPTAAMLRRAAKAYRAAAFTDEMRAEADRLEAIEVLPPTNADALKWRCADEAYFLFEMFSAAAPTGSAGRPFQTVAALIYEAVTGLGNDDMKRSTDFVLQRKRRFRHRFSSTVICK
jgi:hypothetical protein